MSPPEGVKAGDGCKPAWTNAKRLPRRGEVGLKSHAPGGSEIFREYEEAGVVYVDKEDGKKKAILDSRGVLIDKKRRRKVAVAGIGEKDDDIFAYICGASSDFSGGG